MTGTLKGNGALTYNGLILVIGAGDTSLGGVNVSIHGGIYTANVTQSGGSYSFGQAKISLGGNSDIIFDANSISVGMTHIPGKQLSVREIRSDMDP